MRRSILREIVLYRYRYIAGIIIFCVTLVGLLLLRTDLAPTGLSAVEMQSAVSSATYQLTQPLAQPVIDMPYRLLQKASLSIYGVTEFAVILPSIIMAMLTGVAFLMMVWRWFRLNIALITSLIFITSAAFLTAGRTGFPEIMTTFWLSIILLAVTNIIHPAGKTKLWFVVALITVPLSLYTPLMIYPIIAIVVAGVLHPHVRFTLGHIAKWQYAVAAALVVILLSPLVVSLTSHPGTVLELLGIPTAAPSGAQLWNNAKAVGSSFLNIGSAVVGLVPQPIFGAASLILIILGVMKTIVDRYSARAYMLLIWTALFIPIALLNPSKVMMFLIPGYLYLAIGLETLIREWYTLFPKNPYARMVGLIPLVVLLGGIMLSNVAQYFYGFFYGTPTTQYYQQVGSIRHELSSPLLKNHPATLVTRGDHHAFYDLLRRDYPKLSVVSMMNQPITQPTLVQDGATFASGVNPAPHTIITSYKTHDDQVILRLYLPQ